MTTGTLMGIAVLCFNPLNEEWTNLKCSGSVPTPRAGHATSKAGDNIWLYGGHAGNLRDGMCIHDDMYELNMLSFIWTMVQTGQPKPQARSFCSMNTVITDNQLVLLGGIGRDHKIVSDIWILDLSSVTWKQHSSDSDSARWGHTGTTGLNNCVIIIGGMKFRCSEEDVGATTFYVRLEPKSLQQLSLQTVWRHYSALHWKCLPSKLIKLTGT